MGYALHIVRRNDWDDEEEDCNISLQEWLSYVHSDDELKLTNGYQVKPLLEFEHDRLPKA